MAKKLTKTPTVSLKLTLSGEASYSEIREALILHLNGKHIYKKGNPADDPTITSIRVRDVDGD